jgi:hypothetical protein
LPQLLEKSYVRTPFGSPLSVLTSHYLSEPPANLRSNHYRKFILSLLSQLSLPLGISARLFPSNLRYELTQASRNSVFISVYCQHQLNHSLMISQSAALIDGSFAIVRLGQTYSIGWTWGIHVFMFERGGPWQFREDPVTHQ